MKFWNMGKKKDKESSEQPELTVLEKRLAEKAALEAYEENEPVIRYKVCDLTSARLVAVCRRILRHRVRSC